MENTNVLNIKDVKYIVCGRYIDEDGMYLITLKEQMPDTYVYFKINENFKKNPVEEVDAKTKAKFNEMFHLNGNNIYSFKNVYDNVDVFKNKINGKEEQVLLKKALACLAHRLDESVASSLDYMLFAKRVEKLDVNLKTPLDDKELMYANGYLESNGNKVTVLDKYSDDFKMHTLTHELLHLASMDGEKRTIKNMFAPKKHGLCKGTFGTALDEGVTDYIASKATLYETKDVYAHEINMAKGVEKIIGSEKLFECYFTADQDMLIEELTKYLECKEDALKMLGGMDLALKWQINSQRKNKALCMTTFVSESEKILLEAFKNKVDIDITNKTRDNEEIKKDVDEFSRLFLREKYDNVYLDYMATRSYGLNKVNEEINGFRKETFERLEYKNPYINVVDIKKNIDDDFVR